MSASNTPEFSTKFPKTVERTKEHIEVRNAVTMSGYLNETLDALMTCSGFGSPDAKFNLLGAFADKVIEMALKMASEPKTKALMAIRSARNNEGPWAHWVQNYAAYGMEPSRWPEPRPEAPQHIAYVVPKVSDAAYKAYLEATSTLGGGEHAARKASDSIVQAIFSTYEYPLNWYDLFRYYDVDNPDHLVQAMEKHIEGLQTKLRYLEPQPNFQPNKPRG